MTRHSIGQVESLYTAPHRVIVYGPATFIFGPAPRPSLTSTTLHDARQAKRSPLHWLLVGAGVAAGLGLLYLAARGPGRQPRDTYRYEAFIGRRWLKDGITKDPAARQTQLRVCSKNVRLKTRGPRVTRKSALRWERERKLRRKHRRRHS